MEENNQVQQPQQPQQPQVVVQQIVEKPKKPIYKRVWFWILIIPVVLIVIAIASSGGDDKPNAQQTDANGKTIEAVQSDNKIMQGAGTLGKYQVEILSAKRQTTEYTKDELILVTYKWTNNSSNATSFLIALDEKVYQDGIECTSTIAGDGETRKEYADLKPGATLELTLAYELINTTSPVEVEVGESFSFSDAQVVKTFTLQ
ncbi:MAG: DUF5067 domain-containing protein [Oscillospiraceae bacterium]|nr:DUF5067 domain-containing protein [Oscillospiraceae bacterium]